MALNYKKLGEFLRLTDERNSDLSITNLQGVSISKQFIPSIANIIGTDLSSYKIVRKGQFAYGPVTSRNGDKVSIALLESDDCIISSSYLSFEVVDKTKLDPEYLMLWFMRPEFDRYARFMSNGSAREIFDWECMCGVELPVPSIEEQRKIVHDYKVISDRIELLKKLDINLFSTAKVMMKENYREGAKFGNSISISDFCDRTVSGATPSRTNNEYWNSSDVAWLKNGEVKNNIILDTEEYISNLALKETSVKLIDRFSVNMAMYCVSDIQVSYSEIPLTTNQAILNLTVNSFRKASFLYYYLATFGNDITSNANGSAQQNLSKEIIDAHLLLNPNLKDCFFNYFDSNLMERINIAKELSILNKVKTNLLSKLSKEVA